MGKTILAMAAGIIISILLISMASAQLVAFLSNPVTATFTVMPYEEPGFNVPETIFQCLEEGWQEYTRLDGTYFENQGLCVSYVATLMCSQDGWKILTRDDGSNFRNQGQCVAYFMSLGAIELSKQANPELFIIETNEIEEETEEIIIIENEIIEEEIIIEEIVQELIVEKLNSSEANLSYEHNGLSNFNFSCETDFEADTFDWYFGDAKIFLNSTQEINHTFNDNSKMQVTCYALNSTTFKSGHATIRMFYDS